MDTHCATSMLYFIAHFLSHSLEINYLAIDNRTMAIIVLQTSDSITHKKLSLTRNDLK